MSAGRRYLRRAALATLAALLLAGCGGGSQDDDAHAAVSGPVSLAVPPGTHASGWFQEQYVTSVSWWNDGSLPADAICTASWLGQSDMRDVDASGTLYVAVRVALNVGGRIASAEAALWPQPAREDSLDVVASVEPGETAQCSMVLVTYTALGASFVQGAGKAATATVSNVAMHIWGRS